MQPAVISIAPVSEALRRLPVHLQDGTPLADLDDLRPLPELPEPGEMFEYAVGVRDEEARR